MFHSLPLRKTASPQAVIKWIVVSALGLLSTNVKAAEIFTSTAQMEPSQVNTFSELLLSSVPVTPIPVGGKIVVQWPQQYKATPDFMEKATCSFSMPPKVLKVDCKFTKNSTQNIVLTLTGFKNFPWFKKQPVDDYFSISVPNVKTPRSTATTDSFTIETYDKAGTILDFQKKYMKISLQIPGKLETVQITSLNQVVGEATKVQIKFETTGKMLKSDQFRLTLPKWDPLTPKEIKDGSRRVPISMMKFESGKTGVVSCKGLVRFKLKSEIKCSHSKDKKGNDFVLFEDPFAEDVNEGEELEVEMGMIRNPMSGEVKTGFTFSLVDAELGLTSEGFSSLQVFKPASAVKAQLKFSNNKIGSKTSVSLKLESPVPLQAGCKIRIQLPEELTFEPVIEYKRNQEYNVGIKVAGLFGEFREMYYSYYIEERQIEIIGACQSYLQNYRQDADILLANFINPHYAVDLANFKVSVVSKLDDVIFKTNPVGRSFAYSILPGEIKLNPWPTTIGLVDELNSVLFSVQPQDFTMTKKAKLVVYLPHEDFPKLPNLCQVDDISFLINRDTLRCEFSADSDSKVSKLTFTDFLNTKYTKNGDISIDIGVKNIRMPPSTKPTGAFRVEFWEFVQSKQKYMLVDEIKGPSANLISGKAGNRIRSEAGKMINVKVAPQTNFTYQPTTYDVFFSIKHQILPGGSIFMQIPKELKILPEAACLNMSSTFFENQCSATNTDKENCAKCVFNFKENTINIINTTQKDHNHADGLKFKDAAFSISGIRSQRVSRNSENFIFQSRGPPTSNHAGWKIDDYNRFFMPAPLGTPTIDFMSVKQYSTVVGAKDKVSFSFTNPIPLKDGDIITITLPQAAAKNIANSFEACEGGLGNKFLTHKLECVLINLNKLQITVRIKQEKAAGRRLAEAKTEIPAGSVIAFDIKDLINPGSTKPSEHFIFEVTDKNGYTIMKSSDDPAKLKDMDLKTTGAAEMPFVVVDQKPKIANEPTKVYIRFQNAHTMPAKTILDLEWPKQLKLDATKLKCWSNANADGFRRCKILPGKERMIRIYDINLKQLPPRHIISLEIEGLSNSLFAKPTDTFKLLTITPDTLYLIDKKSSGLPIFLLCDHPCKQCKPNEPSSCTECKTQPKQKFPYYFKNQCLERCPQSWYPFSVKSKICVACDANCLDCTANRTKCVACGKDKFLLGNTCLKKCPENFYSDPTVSKCIPCVSPCQTCNKSVNDCTSCLQNQAYQYYFRLNERQKTIDKGLMLKQSGHDLTKQCHNSCPTFYAVYHSLPGNGICTQCDPSCKTCRDNFDKCTTCWDDEFLDRRTNKCLKKCPADISVAHIIKPSDKKRLAKASKKHYTDILQYRTCEMCEPNCMFCHPGHTDVCSKCFSGFNMVESTRVCQKTCPAKTYPILMSLTGDTICLQCEKGCETCQYARNHCLKCQLTHVFHQYSCLTQCPANFKEQSVKGVRTCISAGISCAHGYELDPVTAKCILKYPHCNKGFTLNKQLTECIPMPTFHMPFIFLYAAAIWTFLILIKQNSEHLKREQVISQLLIGYTMLQAVTYIVLWVLSFEIGFDLAIALHTIGIFGIFFLNFITLICILRIIEDRPFHHWRDVYTRSSTALIVLSALFSFKTVRFFKSNLFKKAYFNAAFEDQYRTLTKPLFIVSMIGLLQVIPVCMMDVYTIWQLNWGYEIKTLSIENLILAIVITGLEIYEFVLYKNQQPNYMGIKDYLQGKDQNTRMIARKAKGSLSSQIKVMGGIEEDEDTPMIQNNFKLTDQGYAVRQGPGSMRSKTSKQSGYKAVADEDNTDHMGILDDLIKRMDQQNRIRELHDDLGVLSEADEIEQERRNGTVPSIKEKRKLMNEKRQKFEQFRLEKKRELEMASFSKVTFGEGKIDLRKSHDFNATALFSQRSLSSTIQRKEKKTHLEFYECRSDDEKVRDQTEYGRFHTEYRENFKAAAKIGAKRGMDNRLTQSFDNEIGREMYDGDSMQVASDFKEELSWVSYPPTGVGYWENNPAQEAKFSLFAEKIKSKFNYGNVFSEVAPIKPKIKRELKNARRTQTQGVVEDSDFDPFGSDNPEIFQECSSEDQLSEIDPELCLGIFDRVIDGISASVAPTVDLGDLCDSDMSDEMPRKHTRKRKRDNRDNLNVVAGELSVDSHGHIQVDENGEGEMKDKLNRGVSKKGYLVDDEGNIVDKQGKVVFSADEISQEGEIPERMRTEHRKKQQLQGNQKADLTVEQYMQDQRLNEMALLADEEAEMQQKIDNLAQLSLDAPSEPVYSLGGDVGEHNEATTDGGDIGSMYEIAKTDPNHTSAIQEFQSKQSYNVSPQRKHTKQNTMLERAYRPMHDIPLTDVEIKKKDEHDKSVRRSASRTRKVSEPHPNLGLQGNGEPNNLAYIKMQEAQNQQSVPSVHEPQLEFYSSTDQQVASGQKDNRGFSSQNESRLPFQATQGNISSSEIETNKGPQAQATEAHKFLSMYDSEASHIHQPGMMGGPMTVGVKDLPISDFESAHNQSMPVVHKPEGPNASASKLLDKDYAVGLQFMRESLPGELQDRKKFDKFKYGYMFDFHKPKTPREDSVEQSVTVHESEQQNRPIPFSSLGPDLQPFKAKNKFRDKQAASDLRRAQQTCGSERIRYLENIYLKKGKRQNAATIHSGIYSKGGAHPPQYALTTAEKQYASRHYQRNKTALGGMRSHDKNNNNLRKQNFVEDGMNFMGGRPNQSNLAMQQLSPQMAATNARQSYNSIAQDSEAHTVHNHTIGVKKQLMGNGKAYPQPTEFGNYNRAAGQRDSSTLQALINGGGSIVSSIAPMSDMSPDKNYYQPNGQVADMQSAFNQLRQDSDDNFEDGQGGPFIAAGGEKIEETIDRMSPDIRLK